MNHFWILKSTTNTWELNQLTNSIELFVCFLFLIHCMLYPHDWYAKSYSQSYCFYDGVNLFSLMFSTKCMKTLRE